jgi:hypothetical protein
VMLQARRRRRHLPSGAAGVDARPPWNAFVKLQASRQAPSAVLQMVLCVCGRMGAFVRSRRPGPDISFHEVHPRVGEATWCLLF